MCILKPCVIHETQFHTMFVSILYCVCVCGGGGGGGDSDIFMYIGLAVLLGPKC